VSDALTTLPGVGPALAQRLNKLGIHAPSDLLFHLPLRYQDRSRIQPIASLRAGMECLSRGEVTSNNLRYGRRRSLVITLEDKGRVLTLRFFHFNDSMQRALSVGARAEVFGEVRLGAQGLEMVHPEFRVHPAHFETGEGLTPIYPATEGLRQLTLRKLAKAALERHLNELEDLLPQSLRQSIRLPALQDAIRTLHHPPVELDPDALKTELEAARRRLALEELLAQHLSLRKERLSRTAHQATAIHANGTLSQPWLAALPFQPTSAQTRVCDEILHDLQRESPMQRLLQGDVGSGKTWVAAIAALASIESGAQVALMAPTELLAEQHRRNFQRWFEPLGIQVAWLSGALGAKARRETLEAIASGNAQLAIGTHALFQDAVQFHRLGLVIIDEQHRFGVHQRLALNEKGRDEGNTAEHWPHQLVMTATPIPRTLAMTFYADLDVSVLDELPPGRSPIETVAIPQDRRDDIIQRVHAACREEGRQAYWVCPLIDASEVLEAQAATDTAEDLRVRLPDLRIGLVHGRMKSSERDAVMQQFAAHELDLLVATTVIEVGVDVPNASLMVLDNAERLGLSQLHQLRGRVGRGSVKSHCVLLYRSPLGDIARERLQAMRDTQDGFVIAQKDLELRGPGEVLGTRQSGTAQYRIADILRDQDLIQLLGPIAQQLEQDAPDLAERLRQRWQSGRLDYTKV
jgi:ATP-dependent DNA helicase RecG